MTSELQKSIERFRQQPPIVQWGLIVAVALIVYLSWDSYVAPASRAWAEEADRIQQQVRIARDGDRLAAEIRRHRNTIITVGPVGGLRDIDEGEAHLIDAVNEVLRDFSVSNDSFDKRSATDLPRGALQGLSDVRQLSVAFRFEARPEDAIAIISALESREEINAIREVTMQRIGNRRVSVRLTIESWVVGRSGRTA